MGVVHLAQGPDGRRVALKVLRPHIVGDVEARERLAREVSSLRRITSPRVAEILDADPHGEIPYVVTRYVPGLSLYHHVAEEGAIEGSDLLHFADCLAEALLAVHSVGVLHRDVKPTNVLMEGRSPVLIDFGLARVAEDPRLTQTGWLLGTPGYLAPEILYGDDASPASDVHAWAATIVFAATGRPPYGKGPAMAIMDRVRRGEHDLSGIEDPLRGVLREALSPDPLERPSVHELRGFLGDARERAHVTARQQVRPTPELWTMPLAPAPLSETRADPGHPGAVGRAGRALAAAGRARRCGAGARGHALPAAAASAPGLRPTRRRLQAANRAERSGCCSCWVSACSPVRRWPTRPTWGRPWWARLVLLLRTASVTRQRHGRRQLIRGRARWYDVPTTTLSTPGYAVLALFGAVALVVVASLVALALFSLGYLMHQPIAPTTAVAGLGFAAALWWGPGSGRVREMTRGLATRTAGTEFGGWFVVGMSVLGSAVLLGLLFGNGPNWAPWVHAPWR